MSALDHAAIKALARELGRTADTLIAQGHKSDPFYVTRPRAGRAEWFAGEWHRLAIPTGWHYRRIHYTFVSQPTPLLIPGGLSPRGDAVAHPTPYENTLDCWDLLCDAARDAVVMGLVPDDAFEDHRNAAPLIHLLEPQEAEVEVLGDLADTWLPDFPNLPELRFRAPVVPQPYHVEVQQGGDCAARQHRSNIADERGNPRDGRRT